MRPLTYRLWTRLAQRLIELGKDNREVADHPLEGHGFREPGSRADEYKRMFKLFEMHLKWPCRPQPFTSSLPCRGSLSAAPESLSGLPPLHGISTVTPDVRSRNIAGVITRQKDEDACDLVDSPYPADRMQGIKGFTGGFRIF